MLRVVYTPNVRNHFHNEPLIAMAVDVMARTSPLDGTLRLFRSARVGPFTAIINTADSGADGYRGTSKVITDAIERAMAVAA